MKQIRVMMWSDDHRPEALNDMDTIVKFLDGYIMATPNYFAVSKEPFTAEEAKQALLAWVEEMNTGGMGIDLEGSENDEWKKL